MQRFFSYLKNISGGKIIISDRQQFHHIKDVLRLKEKEKVIVFDEKGNEYGAEIQKISAQSIILEIKDKSAYKTGRGFKLTVACAIPKKSRMDDIIDKLTQLGVERIIPLKTERVIAKLDKHKERLRNERWKRIAVSAAQQSQRNTLPVIEPIKDIKEVLSSSGDFDLKLIPTLAGERKALRDVFSGLKAGRVLVLIGPEGDFTDEEVGLAVKSGCIPVSLGDAVLRVETAALAVASFIRLYANH
jgi:16S rRNA (uracil1498-N3)-methyltransferase